MVRYGTRVATLKTNQTRGKIMRLTKLTIALSLIFTGCGETKSPKNERTIENPTDFESAVQYKATTTSRTPLEPKQIINNAMKAFDEALEIGRKAKPSPAEAAKARKLLASVHDMMSSLFPSSVSHREFIQRLWNNGKSTQFWSRTMVTNLKALNEVGKIEERILKAQASRTLPACMTRCGIAAPAGASAAARARYLGAAAKMASVIAMIDVFASNVQAAEVDWDDYHQAQFIENSPFGIHFDAQCSNIIPQMRKSLVAKRVFAVLKQQTTRVDEIWTKGEEFAETAYQMQERFFKLNCEFVEGQASQAAGGWQKKDPPSWDVSKYHRFSIDAVNRYVDVDLTPGSEGETEAREAITFVQNMFHEREPGSPVPGEEGYVVPSPMIPILEFEKLFEMRHLLKPSSDLGCFQSYNMEEVLLQEQESDSCPVATNGIAQPQDVQSISWTTWESDIDDDEVETLLPVRYVYDQKLAGPIRYGVAPVQHGYLAQSQVIGDVNGDDKFNTSDIVAMFATGQDYYERGRLITDTEIRLAIDWNWDGYFNSSDFQFLLSEGQYQN